MNRSCYCEDCNHIDNLDCEFNGCDCCGTPYEHDSDFEKEEEDNET